MTVAEARALLANLPDAAPLCFTVGEALLGATEIVSTIADGDGYSVSFDGARDDSVHVAVVS